MRKKEKHVISYKIQSEYIVSGRILVLFDKYLLMERQIKSSKLCLNQEEERLYTLIKPELFLVKSI